MEKEISDDEKGDRLRGGVGERGGRGDERDEMGGEGNI